MCDLTVIILTKNEEKNIVNCIESVRNIAKRIVVIDSYSDDRTKELAELSGAEIIQNKWTNYATQFMFGLENAKITTKWVLRLDADERLTDESSKELENLIIKNDNTDINGIILRFEVVFLGKKLRHGGIYPFRKLCAFKRGKGHMENRNMDEHIVLDEGKSIEMKSDSMHLDYKDLTYWIDKHNKYSSSEVLDYIGDYNSDNNNLDRKAKIKRFFKYRIYYKLPMGTRAHMYYLYRYILLRGFLDGKEGKIFCFLQAYWYRFLVDAKIYEKERGKNEGSTN